MVPKARVELAHPCGHMVLNYARLPFRHFGKRERFDAQSRSHGQESCCSHSTPLSRNHVTKWAAHMVT